MGKRIYILMGSVVFLAVAVFYYFYSSGAFKASADVDTGARVELNSNASYDLNGQKFDVSSQALSLKIMAKANTSATAGETLLFKKGFTALGISSRTATSPITSNSMRLYSFDSVANNWQTTDTTEISFLEPGKAYYVYNSDDQKSINLESQTESSNPVFELSKGWNFLWTVQERTRANLIVKINGVEGSLNEWIENGAVYSKVFIVENEDATDSCNYFNLFDVVDEASECYSSANEKVSTIPAKKAFWVYVK